MEVWGITSLGNKDCGTEGTPGIFTSVKDHLKWIRNVVKDKNDRFKTFYKYKVDRNEENDDLEVNIVMLNV